MKNSGLYLSLGAKKKSQETLEWQSRWKIAKHVYNQVLVIGRCVIQVVRFLTLTCDEVTIVDNQSWISIHGYCVQDWCKSLFCFLMNAFLKVPIPKTWQRW
jgi:hypothetical protein